MTREEIVKKILDDQIDMYTLAFYPQEYYSHMDMGFVNDISKNLQEMYHKVVIDKGMHPDDDFEDILNEMMNILDEDRMI